MARCEDKKGFTSGVIVRTWSESDRGTPDCRVRGNSDVKHLIEVKSICLFELLIHCECSTDPSSRRIKFNCLSDSPPNFEVTDNKWKRRNISLGARQTRQSNDINDVTLLSIGPAGPEPIDVNVTSKGGAYRLERKTLSITIDG